MTDGDRRRMKLSVSQNKRSRKWQEAKLDSEFGPHTCGHCRAEPCGACWPHAACCHRCTHPPMPRWKLTHVLWYRKKPYYVMEVAARRPGASAGFRPSEGAGSANQNSLVPRLQKASGSAASESSWSGSGSGAASSASGTSEPGERNQSRRRGTSSFRAAEPGLSSGPASKASGTSERSERNQRRSRGTSSFRAAEPVELLDDEQRWGVQRSPAAREAVSDALYYRWDGVCQWVRRARTHYFLGVRVSPVEFLRNLPNEEEKIEFAPRERPPNPFEEGIGETDEGEIGDPFSDQTEPAPEQADDGARYYKRGLQVSEFEEEGEDGDGTS